MATGSSSPASAQSKASFSTAALPPTDVNTVLRLTSARVGDGVDRRRPVPPLDVQLAAGVDDAAPGRLRLLVPQRGVVRAVANRHGSADVLDDVTLDNIHSVTITLSV